MSPDRGNSSLDRIVGGLESSMEHVEEKLEKIAGLLEKSARDAGNYRQHVREQLSEISTKVDPLAVKLETMDMTIKAHEAVLSTYAQREERAKGAAWLARWLWRFFYLVGGTAFILWGDKIKTIAGHIWK